MEKQNNQIIMSLTEYLQEKFRDMDSESIVDTLMHANLAGRKIIQERHKVARKNFDDLQHLLDKLIPEEE